MNDKHLEIKTTKGEKFLVDLAFLHLTDKKWYIGPQGYVERSEVKNGKHTHYKLHRVVMGAKSGQQVDHINGNKADNRIANLRFCTRSGNSANSKLRKDNKVGYKGVYRQARNKKFEVKIMHHQKAIYLSRFDSPEEAAMAYDNAALTLFGPFAKLNQDLT